MVGKKFSTAQVAVQILISSLQENDFFNVIKVYKEQLSITILYAFIIWL